MKYILIGSLFLTFTAISYGFHVATHKTITEKAYFITAAKVLGIATDVEYTPLSLFEAAFGSSGSHMNSTLLTSKPSTKYFETYLSETLDNIFEVENNGDSRYTWNTLLGPSESYNLIKALQASMRTSINGGRYEELRILCTQMFVLTQNFYARTNYIELGNSEPAPYLVQTSSLPTQIKNLGIDKEDHFNAYHKLATDLALMTTTAHYVWIKSTMKNDTVKFKEFLGISGGKTIAFNIDDTGSMSNEIEAAKQHALKIVDSYAKSLNPPSKYMIQTFNDPTIGTIVITESRSTIVSTFSTIYAHEGGDTPEMCLSGLENILINLPDKSYAEIFVYTDAPAKDTYKETLVLGLIDQKKARVAFLLTGSFSAKTMSVYKAISKASDGDIIEVSPSNILNTVDFLVERGDTSSEPIFNLNNLVGTNEVFFDVDASVTSIKVSFNNLNFGSKIEVKQPSGALANPSTSTNLAGFIMYEFKYPAFGSWSLMVTTSSSSAYSVKLNFQSETSVKVRIVDEIWGDEVEGVEYKDKIPINYDIGVIVDIIGVSSDSHPQLSKLELIKTNGEVISTHSLLQDPLKKTRFYVPFLKSPKTEFQVKVSGADALIGRSYQRLNKDVYDVESLIAKAFLKSIVGTTYTIHLDMKNYNDQKQKINLKVKTCADFTLNSYYTSFNVLFDGYDSLSDVVVLNSVGSKPTMCSVEIVFTDQATSSFLFSKIIDMNSLYV